MRLGLQGKFLLATSLVLGAFSATATVINVRAQEEVIRQRLVEKAAAMGSILGATATDPFVLYDVKSLRLFLADALEQRDVVYAYIFDDEGRIITDGTSENRYRDRILDDAVSRRALTAEAPFIQQGSDVLDVVEPISLGRKRVGGVRLGFSLRTMEEEIRSIRDRNIAFSGGFVLFGILLTHLLVRTITRPLDRLIAGTKGVARGELNKRIDVRSNDELQVLAESFNQMTGALERSREELILAKDYADNIVKSMLESLLVVSPDGDIRRVNVAACTLLGYEEDELVGQPVRKIFEGEAPPFAGSEPGAFREKGFVSNVETTCVGKDGRRIVALFSSSVMRDHQGRNQGIVCVVQDITERKRAEESRRALYEASLKLQEPLGLQERLERLLKTARDVLELDRLNVFLADTEGRWLQVEATTETEEPLAMLRVPIGPEGGGIAQAYLTQEPVFWHGRAPVPEDLRLKPPYDQLAALRSRVFAIVPLIVQGRAIGVLGADRRRGRPPFEPPTRELLQLFAAQAALAIEAARLYEGLEAKVHARTRELQATNAQLREAMHRAEEASRAKSEFLANVSHELRTPLNSVIGFAELLAAQTFGPLNAKQQGYAHNIRTSGRHLLNLINDILDLSEMEAGRLHLAPEPFSLVEALQAALIEIQPQAEAKGLALHLDVEACPPTLVADPDRFRQILQNLLSNAVKFTPSGKRVRLSARSVQGVRPAARGEPGPVREAPTGEREPEGDCVEIAVQDAGIGIKAEDLPKLFQPFTQLEAVFTKQYQGAGLGLALTKRLVEVHGGRIRVESAGEGEGSTFTVRLPLRPL